MLLKHYSTLRPWLFKLPPEYAHAWMIKALKYDLLSHPKSKPYSVLQQSLMGQTFPSPIGLAAGFDKNGETGAALQHFGFGFAELGTVTQLPQAGNPRPRLFRLVEDEAVINRLGFNNKGVAYFRKSICPKAKRQIPLGINIGMNKDAADAVADFVGCYQRIYDLADYVTVNISSPNTKGLRSLQEESALRTLVSALLEARDRLSATHGHVPLLVKIAPDNDEAALEAIASVIVGSGVDGLIVSNTTITRPEELISSHKTEQGGLSGKPLLPLANQCLASMHRLTKGKLLLIGVGGIASVEDVYQKLKAGASLVQLYSALVYQGLGLITRLNHELAARLEQEGVRSIGELHQ